MKFPANVHEHAVVAALLEDRSVFFGRHRARGVSQLLPPPSVELDRAGFLDAVAPLVATRENLERSRLVRRYGPQHGSTRSADLWSDCVVVVAACLVAVTVAVLSGSRMVQGVVAGFVVSVVAVAGCVAVRVRSLRVELSINRFELSALLSVAGDDLSRSISVLLGVQKTFGLDRRLCDLLLRLAVLHDTGSLVGRLSASLSSDVLHAAFVVTPAVELVERSVAVCAMADRCELLAVLEGAPVESGGWAYGCGKDPLELIDRYWTIASRVEAVAGADVVLCALVESLSSSSGTTVDELCDAALAAVAGL